MAEHSSDDSIEVHCGRCGKLLIVRLEDITGRRTIDCGACEHTLPAENALPVPGSSRAAASAYVEAGHGTESLATHALLDDVGQPLSPRLQRVLDDIAPKFRQRFPALGDELLVTEVLEEAGRRIANHERASGPVENLDAYTWVTVRNLARSRIRQSSMRLLRSTLGSQESEAVFDALHATHGAAEQIEAEILVQEVLARLTAEERWLCARKQLGCSSREIAREQGTSVARVNTLFYRMKRKIRNALSEVSAGAAASNTGPPTNTRAARRRRRRG
jgi:RNA polymerase sigma factor (sigma-70 family)